MRAPLRRLAPWLVALVLMAAIVRTGAAAGLAGIVFSGTVSGNDQGFITGATVVIDGPVHKETKTDADGRFTITDVPSGRYQLKVSADGYLGMERPMDVGSASVSVDIQLLRLAGL
ncbi:MAG: carboxypeptidase-like regulatory domain-containing protein [Vicinamibacterales bacterium]